MNLEELLDALYMACRNDEALQRELFATSFSRTSVRDFCAAAYAAGCPIAEMDLVFAGEEEYAARRRSTNGGGENSPALSGAQDLHELFLSRLTALQPLRGRIGVIDSGAGGISILRELVRILPEEKYVYFGDSAYNPYGSREDTWIRDRALYVSDRLIRAGIRMLVVACNTATSAAIGALREAFPEIPVIGTEPALRPAARSLPAGSTVLVMATEQTLQLEKYRQLAEDLSGSVQFLPVPCPGLADRIEQGDFEAPDLTEMLNGILAPYRNKAEGIVLGCTHYPLIRSAIAEAAGGNVVFFDGAEGVARECAHRLPEYANGEAKGEEQVLYFSSDGEKSIRMYKDLLAEAGEEV